MTPPPPFDFNAAVSAPFYMQPGLRRMAPGALHLTPAAPGSPHLREKLAVLSSFWPQALLMQPGFDAGPALAALRAQAQLEHPQAWTESDGRAQALMLGAAVNHQGKNQGHIEVLTTDSFGVGEEVARCLQGLPPAWRLVGLLSLTFVEDFALVEGAGGTIPWLAVCLPSHWAPEDKVGLPFAAVHAPVADNQRVLRAAPGLLQMLTRADDPARPPSESVRWERFVWNVTDQPRLHAHPARSGGRRWEHMALEDMALEDTALEQAWWRTERQTFLPVPGLPAGQAQAIFTIQVQVQPLAQALTTAVQAKALHDAVASMSPAVLAYRGLQAVREPLLHWLLQRT